MSCTDTSLASCQHVRVKDFDTRYFKLENGKIVPLLENINNKVTFDPLEGAVIVMSPDGVTEVSRIGLKKLYGIDEFLGYYFKAPTIEEFVAKYPPDVNVMDTTGVVIAKAWSTAVHPMLDYQHVDATTTATLYYAMKYQLPSTTTPMKPLSPIGYPTVYAVQP